MATYLSGSNIQSDPMQTLHLMNPGYTGFTDASNASNLVLVNPSAGIGQHNAVGNNSQEQQQYIGFPLPPGLTQSSLVQQPTLATMYNSSLGQQSPSSLFTNRVGNNPYSWSTVNELSFLPSNDVTQITQSLAARLTSPNSGQQSNSDISQFNIRRHSVHEEQTSVLDNGVALGLDMDNSHGAAGPSQGLSLSLSPQQHPIQLQYYNMQPNESSIRSCARLAHVNAEDNDTRGERIPNKWIGNLSQFRASSRDGLLGTGFQNPMNDISSRQRHPDANVLTVVGFGGLLSGSKYLKPAQELLDEVVSVRRGIKSSLSKNVKLTESWMASSSLMDGPFATDRGVTENLSTAKEGIPCTTSMPSVASISVQHSSTVSELTQQEKQELQMKKARLMAMLDEVDRRYKQYYGQMQMVVDSFESAAGLGSAKMYTALALQTISRHFRCLRDAISSQIRLASTALSEENPSSPALGRGETSRLRYVDQHFRQQRALQQLGMMQQHAWRPQRGLPERSVSVLRAWLFEHFLHPYPKDADKIMLARQTGLTRNQVSNWFINARVRLWKPMVEEMYLEEKKESAMDGTPSTDRKSGGDNFMANQGDGGNTDTSDQGSKQARSDQAGSSDDGENQMMPDRRHAASDMLQQSAARNTTGLNIAADSANLGGHLVQEIQGVLKKPRNGIALHDPAALLSGVEVQELKAKERNEEAFEHEKKQSFKMIGMEQGYGAYHAGGADRYVQEGFASVSRYPSPHVAGGGHGVSLTLGLQHCDGLSLSGAPQQQQQQHGYLYQQQSHGGGLVPQLSTAAATRRLDPNAGSTASQDYYSSVNDDSPTSYEALSQLHNRKRFAHQLLQHDFVA